MTIERLLFWCTASRLRLLAALGCAISAVVGVVALAASRRPFTPIVACFRRAAWQGYPGLLETMVAGDLGIFAAYVLIPVSVVVLWWRIGRPMVLLPPLLGAGVFVLSCGLDHLSDVIASAVSPIYWFVAEKRVTTAAISLGFWAALTWLWTPRIVAFVRQAQIDRCAAVESARLDRLERVEAQRARDEARQALKERDAAQAGREEEEARFILELNHRADELAQQQKRVREALDLAGESAAQAETACVAEKEARIEAEQQAARAAQGELAARRAEFAAREQAEQLQLALMSIRELGAVVIRVHASPCILVAPIIGTLDSRRMEQLQAKVTEEASRREATCVILDLEGVEMVDTAVAQCLVQTQKMLQLIGCRCAITGLSGAIAQTIVSLGPAAELPRPTLSDLAAGLAYALGSSGAAPVHSSR